MAAILPASPLTLQDVFLAALNSGRVVPEDATHVQFANALMEQLASRGCAPMSTEAMAADDFDYGEMWRACLAAVASRVESMPRDGFTPATCASALRALASTSWMRRAEFEGRPQ